MMQSLELLRVGPVGAERPIARIDGAAYSLDGVAEDIDGEFLAGGGIPRVREAHANGALPIVIDYERIGAPIARPQAVICIGQNYAAHAAESGAQPPSELIVFFKHPNTVVGPYDEVRIPPRAVQVDWEVELGIVIGRQARYVGSAEEAMATIAGYVVCNDVSEREYQFVQSLGQWSKAKGSETFCPIGQRSTLVPTEAR